jgi:glucosamine 6-phosphate synthetase-like amidotransferase/phosphosugar isomerase protein
VFVSDTDTEVIPKLCLYLHRQYEGNITLPKLAMEVMVRLEGAFALLIKSATFYPGQLLACKRGSPLVFTSRWSPMSGDAGDAGDATNEDLDTLACKDQAGSAPGVTEVWLASDAAALLKHSRAMTVLDDEDLLHVDAAGKLTVYNLMAVTKQYKNVTALLEGLGRTCASQLSVTRRARRVSMELEAVMKVRGLPAAAAVCNHNRECCGCTPASCRCFVLATAAYG